MLKYTNLFIGACLFLLLFSCSTEGPEIAINVEKDLQVTPLEETSTLQYLLSIGISKDNIKDQGDYYLVEGDMRFFKNIDYNSNNPSGGRLQKRVHIRDLVSKDKQNNIKVYIASDVPSSWKTATREGMIMWNNVPACLIHFSEVTNLSQADIHVQILVHDGWNDICGWGQAELPIDGVPGATIHFDLIPGSFSDNPECKAEDLSAIQKRYTAVHEFGHTIGFFHTNDSFKGYLVQGTPNRDSQSLMNGNQAGLHSGFSSYDILAAQVMYPDISELCPDTNYEHDYFFGRWRDDDTDRIGVRRYNEILLDTDSDTGFENVSYLGLCSEEEYFTGDFNNDGKDDIAYRNGNVISADTDMDWYADYTNVVGNGSSEDEYLVGDFDGDGRDDIAVRRNSQILADTDHNGSLNFSMTFGDGDLEDYYLVGDWHNLGKDEVATVKGNSITFLTKPFRGIRRELTMTLGNGQGESAYISADFNGDGKDDFGVIRNNTVYGDTDRNGSFSLDYSKTIGNGLY